MKKLYSFLVFSILVTLTGISQNSLIATLSHDGQMRAFYGIDALKEAHAASVAGDVITLSSGTFAATNITKAITLRGAGMLTNAETQTYPTYISGTFSISASDTTHRLTFEGLNCLNQITYYTCIKPIFTKCKFSSFNYANDLNYLSQATFVNCYITSFFNHGTKNTCTFINCYVAEPYDYIHTATATLEMDNCVILKYHNLYSQSILSNSSFNNCIFVSTSDPFTLSSSNQAFNCIITGCSKNIFANMQNSTNQVVADVTSIFKEYTGLNYRDEISFELTDEAAKKYLGTDGTQVGLFGGSLPFDPMVSSLQITKCNVAGKSTVDGKLSVDIEVSGVN